jgi:integrase
MNKFEYNSYFKNHIQDFIELKQAIGYKYYTEAGRLKCFDSFILSKYPECTELTKEVILAWCSKTLYEAQANQCSRASIIRQFAKYLDAIGLKAYILPKSYYPAGAQYIPYIYSSSELTRIFNETDKCHYCYECPYRHLIMPLIFRMIYICGLRASEARLLKIADVDLENGILTIYQSKNNNSRLVPMSNELTKRCQVYAKLAHPYSLAEDYYFAPSVDKPMTLGNLYKNFRRFLWRARISHRGRGNGPRVHDLRHTFAVHCLKKWVEQGYDLNAYLPILKTYMGHDSFTETAYYLRLTADVFPSLVLKLENKYPNIIPELGRINNETY